jgi:hypothetical protein
MSSTRARLHLEALEPRTLMSISVGSIVTPTTTVPEAEENVAAFPGNSNQLVAVISDYSQGPVIGRLSKYSYSADNGATWQEGFVPTSGGHLVTGDGLTWESNWDPSVTVDSAGNVYLSGGYKHYSGSAANGMYVAVGTVGPTGLAFTTEDIRPVYVDQSATTAFSEDKPWIAADTTQSAFRGNVYFTWTHSFQTPKGQQSEIWFARSTDRGETWGAHVLIYSSSDMSKQAVGPQVAVGPDGTVYVAFGVGSPNEPANPAWLYLAKSVNGGLTFGPSHAITPSQIQINNATNAYKVRSLPSMAVAPDGTVLVVYPRYDPGTATYQVGLIQSTNGSQNFSSYQVLNDSTAGLEFQPAVAVDASNQVIWVTWLDTRNHPTNPLYYDLYTVDSRDGTTFSSNVRVTPQSDHAEIVGSAGFLGDYGGLAASGGTAHPVWTSGGAGLQGGNGQLQIATLIDKKGHAGAPRNPAAFPAGSGTPSGDRMGFPIQPAPSSPGREASQVQIGFAAVVFSPGATPAEAQRPSAGAGAVRKGAHWFPMEDSGPSYGVDLEKTGDDADLTISPRT